MAKSNHAAISKLGTGPGVKLNKDKKYQKLIDLNAGLQFRISELKIILESYKNQILAYRQTLEIDSNWYESMIEDLKKQIKKLEKK